LKKVKVGIVGCGNISDIYLKNLTQVFNIVEVTACADLISERAVKEGRHIILDSTCEQPSALDMKIDSSRANVKHTGSH
jgi:predicted dehydrogenase